MKTAFKLTLMLVTMAVAFVACDKNDSPYENGNINTGENNSPVTRDIIYTVGNNERRQTLENESEWDLLLDQLCDQAMDGSEITFYNINQTTLVSVKKSTKEDRTISTTSREEIKRWMKKMEKQGLTVHVTYDDYSGTWRGEAYATAPALNTQNTILGTWHFKCMVVSQLDSTGQLLGSDLFEPEASTGALYYTFRADGTLTLTITGMDESTATESSTWSLSDDGVLSSGLMPNGVNWNVNWITSNTIILSQSGPGTEAGIYEYKLHFESVNTIE